MNNNYASGNQVQYLKFNGGGIHDLIAFLNGHINNYDFIYADNHYDIDSHYLINFKKNNKIPRFEIRNISLHDLLRFIERSSGYSTMIEGKKIIITNFINTVFHREKFFIKNRCLISALGKHAYHKKEINIQPIIAEWGIRIYKDSKCFYSPQKGSIYIINSSNEISKLVDFIQAVNCNNIRNL